MKKCMYCNGSGQMSLCSDSRYSGVCDCEGYAPCDMCNFYKKKTIKKKKITKKKLKSNSLEAIYKRFFKVTKG